MVLGKQILEELCLRREPSAVGPHRGDQQIEASQSCSAVRQDTLLVTDAVLTLPIRWVTPFGEVGVEKSQTGSKILVIDVGRVHLKM